MRWPEGFRSAGVAAGIKTNGDLDLGVLVPDRLAAWAGTFTQNGAAAAPVCWSRSLLGRPIRALVVNSGNANACTGRAGDQAVAATAQAAADAVECQAAEVLVASTGPIGKLLPVERVVGSIPSAIRSLSSNADDFARSILTTDTRVKRSSSAVAEVSLLGVAKGAAMVAPNMATMLAFIATDAAIDGASLQRMLSRAVDGSFNRISIDGCESTNDSVFLVASGAGGSVDEDLFAKALEEVCWDLAEQIVRDGEAAQRFVRIEIRGATNESSAANLGRAVAVSALWRAAVHGGDPNWGRILSAIGSVDRDLELDEVEVALGSETLFARGEPVGSVAAARREMSGAEIVVTCNLHRGRHSAQVLTTDLSPGYVTLNAGGMS